MVAAGSCHFHWSVERDLFCCRSGHFPLILKVLAVSVTALLGFDATARVGVLYSPHSALVFSAPSPIVSTTTRAFRNRCEGTITLPTCPAHKFRKRCDVLMSTNTADGRCSTQLLYPPSAVRPARRHHRGQQPPPRCWAAFTNDG